MQALQHPLKLCGVVGIIANGTHKNKNNLAKIVSTQTAKSCLAQVSPGGAIKIKLEDHWGRRRPIPGAQQL